MFRNSREQHVAGTVAFVVGGASAAFTQSAVLGVATIAVCWFIMISRTEEERDREAREKIRDAEKRARRPALEAQLRRLYIEEASLPQGSQERHDLAMTIARIESEYQANGGSLPLPAE